MRLSRIIASFFLPDNESWLKHANPWSVWTRFITLPFVVLAIWSRVWLGWYCILPIAILVIWIVVNPRLFNKPSSYESWGSRAVLGERVYITERASMPAHHKVPVAILTVLQILGGLILIYGLWQLDIYHALYGMALVYMAKMWFLDRMVWLYEDTRE